VTAPPDLEELYARAAEALKARDYDVAADLLRQVLVTDEDFKDASSLLAKAIRLKRRRWYTDSRYWGAIGAAVLLVVGILLAPYLSPATSRGGRAADEADSAPTGTSQRGALQTAAPTLAPTAVPLAWKRVYIGQEWPRDSITAIALHPTDPDVMYVGTYSSGIFKSIDGGLSWQPAHSGLGRAWIHSLALDPSNPDTLYAGTSLGGVFKTTDGGANWTHMFGSGGWEWISIVILDPGDLSGQHLYYTSAGPLFESNNAGESWSHIGGSSSCPDRFVAVAAIPGGAGVMLAAQNSGESTSPCQAGVYRSLDGGRSWQHIPVGPPIDWWGPGTTTAFIRDDQDEDTLFLTAEHVVYWSRDLGETWEVYFAGVCSGFASDPSRDEAAYCIHEGQLLLLDPERQKSLGEAAFEGGLLNQQRISTSASSQQTLVIGGRGISISHDSGGTFTEHSGGLGAEGFDLALATDDMSELLIPAADSCPRFASSDAGRTWEEWSDPSCRAGLREAPLTIPVEQPQMLYRHPKNPQLLYAIYGRDKPPYVHFSKDGGATWEPAVGMGSISDARLFFDHQEGQRIYLIGDLDFFRSDDTGWTWRECGRPDARQPADRAGQQLRQTEHRARGG